MNSFTTLFAAAAFTAATATTSLAGSPVAADEDPFIEPPVPAGSSAGSSAGSLAGGALPIVAGVAAIALVAAAASDSSDSASTHPTSP